MFLLYNKNMNLFLDEKIFVDEKLFVDEDLYVYNNIINIDFSKNNDCKIYANYNIIVSSV
jgi:hypothetical protein